MSSPEPGKVRSAGSLLLGICLAVLVTGSLTEKSESPAVGEESSPHAMAITPFESMAEAGPLTPATAVVPAAEPVAVPSSESGLNSAGQVASVPSLPSDLRLLEEVRRWAEVDPQAAAAWLLSFSSYPEARPLFEQVAALWAVSDFPAALQWVDSIPGGQTRDAAALVVAYQACRTDLPQALQLAATVADSRQKTDFLIHAGRQWALTDANAAIDWSAGLSEDAVSQAVLAAIAIDLSETDRHSATNLVDVMVTDPRLQSHAAAAITQRLFQPLVEPNLQAPVGDSELFLTR